MAGGPLLVGADTGGTFTDVITGDGRMAKVPSTPDDPGRAVRDGTAVLADGGRPRLLTHGTTVATNALLERRGARVALVTTAGFADVIEIARQDRPSLYDPWADRPAPLVPRELRLEVTERLAADGSVLVPLDAATVPEPPEGVEAVAVCLLHADLNPAHEQAVADRLAAAGWDVSASHRISPEFREFERTSTTVVNAYLRPKCRGYLEALADAADEVLVMGSSGGLLDVAGAAATPAALLLSGPAGGVRAAAAVAVACGFPDAVTFDMGGTSTDVCLILDGRPEPAAERDVDGYPVRLPSLDVHTIGAGGGSIARIDAGGALVVGPESAGAVPGPACYGRGGTRPTVTDANLAAGRIPADAAFGALGVLDGAAARQALADAGVSAEGVLAVVNAGMEQALRAVSVERGVDPRGLALVAFGGAGPLHACELADAAGFDAVIVPAAAGVLSALGLLCSPMRRELVRSRVDPADHTGLVEDAAALAAEAVAALGASGKEVAPVEHGGPVRTEVAFDCRYAGQSHEIRVADPTEFPAEHARRNGYERPGTPIEVTAVRALAERPSSLTVAGVLDAGPFEAWLDATLGPDPADTLDGPRVLVREDCTIYVPSGWRAGRGALGSLVLRRIDHGDSTGAPA